jgi:ribonuclease HI
MAKKKKKYYAVATGKNPGIYTEWFGSKGAEIQVKGFAGAVFKGFSTQEAAEDFIKQNAGKKRRIKPKAPLNKTKARQKPKPMITPKDGSIVIYTDGGCLSNPGPGGYGVVIKNGKKTKEFSGGYRLTTNNRMELMACIVGLGSLKKGSSVILYSDSKYVVDGITKGWAVRWQANGWMRTKKEKAINPDLWEKLLDLCGEHDVQFRWVKGHAGHAGNERCDQLATAEAAKVGLPVDKAYENNKYQ